MVEHTIISLGTLETNELWDERGPVRTGHATTVLLRQGDTKIIVNPGLPGQILEARLGERAGITPSDITHVFLTSFHPECRRGIELFDSATWLISEAEREGVGVPLATQAAHAKEAGEDELMQALVEDIKVLSRCVAAGDQIAPGIDLFPLPGVSPGTAGLLIPAPRYTLLITGDAVPTAAHLSAGRVLQRAADVAQAQESLKEVIEIADLVIPGRDGLTVNPVRSPF